MTPDVFLKSLEFEKTIHYYLGSVKANLSYGVSSELFCKEKFPHGHNWLPEVFEFDHDKSIGIVGADVIPMMRKEWLDVNRPSHYAKIEQIRFYDNEENQLYGFNATPFYASDTTIADFETYQIGDNEELIGVYGVAGK